MGSLPEGEVGVSKLLDVLLRALGRSRRFTTDTPKWEVLPHHLAAWSTQGDMLWYVLCGSHNASAVAARMADRGSSQNRRQAWCHRMWPDTYLSPSIVAIQLPAGAVHARRLGSHATAIHSTLPLQGWLVSAWVCGQSNTCCLPRG